MREPLVIVGGGGFAREVLDVVEAINLDQSAAGGDRFEVVGVVADPAPDMALLAPYGVPYLGGVDQAPNGVGYVIAIGLHGGPHRRRIDQQLGQRPCPALIHPNAAVGRGSTFGPGTVICSHVSIAGNVHTGRHVHIGANTAIGHDATLEDYSTVSPLVAVSGNVTVGAEATLGTGSAIRERTTIGAGATVAMGAAVITDIPDSATARGVPART